MEYLKEAYRLLSDNATYEILQNDPLPEYKVELTELMNQAFFPGSNTKIKETILPNELYQDAVFLPHSKCP